MFFPFFQRAVLMGCNVCPTSLADETPVWDQEGGRSAVRALSARKRQVLFDPGHVGFVNEGGLCKVSLALGTLALKQVAFACLRAKDLTRPRYFKPLGHGLLRLATCD